MSVTTVRTKFHPKVTTNHAGNEIKFTHPALLKVVIQELENVNLTTPSKHLHALCLWLEKEYESKTIHGYAIASGCMRQDGVFHKFSASFDWSEVAHLARSRELPYTATMMSTLSDKWDSKVFRTFNPLLW